MRCHFGHAIVYVFSLSHLCWCDFLTFSAEQLVVKLRSSKLTARAGVFSWVELWKELLRCAISEVLRTTRAARHCPFYHFLFSPSTQHDDFNLKIRAPGLRLCHISCDYWQPLTILQNYGYLASRRTFIVISSAISIL
jgi:hypothetical protein